MMMMILFLCLVLFVSILFFKNQSSEKKGKPFASPPKLPLLGNLHQLGQHPHRTLCYLSYRYGPLMLLHFGSVPVIVASTADAARDVLKTHDRELASRPRSKIYEKLLYNGRNMASASYGEYWRQLKALSTLHIFSNKMVRTFRDIREEEVGLMMDKFRESNSKPVDLTKITACLTNDVVCRAAFGEKYGAGTEFKKLIDTLMFQLGTFGVGTFVPWLGWIDRVSGLMARVEKTAKDFDNLLERIVQDHEDKRGGKANFVDVLLALQREKGDGFKLDRLSVKALILDVFVGGTDTSSTLIEWEMTELLRNPECLKTLQEEVRTVCEGKSFVTEDDLQDMPYLKAVLKEALRLHPPVPLMVPHLSTEVIMLRDHHIPQNRQVMVNLWAIGREKATWGPDAEEFRPERHLKSDADFRGQDFELIPFGAGRRMCPGTSFAVALNELALANLIHGFDWQATEDLNAHIEESVGSVIRRKFPLHVIATPAAV